MKFATAALALALVAGFGANAMANEMAPATGSTPPAAMKDFKGVDCKTLKGDEMKACETAHAEMKKEHKMHEGKEHHNKTEKKY